MDNLMVLVNECEKFKFKPLERGEEKIVKIEELKNLGFKALAQKLEKELIHDEKLSRIAEFGYITIGKEKIQAFLDKKSEAYNEKNPVEKHKDSGYVFYGNSMIYSNQISSPFQTEEQIRNENERYRLKNLKRYFSSPTNHLNLTKEGTIGSYNWTEVPIELYETLPPSDVLKSVEVHKARNVFDYMTIASVNAVVDPLLLGRIEGRSEAWFIAQWGDDVQLDDVI